MQINPAELSFFGLGLPELTATDDVAAVRFGPGDVIFYDGVDIERLFLIASGRVRVGRHRADRECLFSVLGPGDVFGEEAVFDPGPTCTCATAMTEVEAFTVGRKAIVSLLVANPDAAQRLMRIMARRIRRLSGNITDTVYADVSARVAKQLLALAQRFGTQEDGAMRVPMELTQEQFAQLVGTSRESVNKALCEFVDRGWISTHRDAIVIKQSEPLATRMHGARRPGRRNRQPELAGR